MQMIVGRKTQRRAVAGRQQFRLMLLAAAPYRADGVDDVLRRQLVAVGYFRRSGHAAAERLALLKKFAPRGTVDRAVDPAAAQQRGVCRIDDGVDRERGNIGDYDLKPRRPKFDTEKRC